MSSWIIEAACNADGYRNVKAWRRVSTFTAPHLREAMHHFSRFAEHHASASGQHIKEGEFRLVRVDDVEVIAFTVEHQTRRKVSLHRTGRAQ